MSVAPAAGRECHPARSLAASIGRNCDRFGGQHDDRLEIRVLDDGVGLPADWNQDTSPGVGLSVPRQRIGGLHPNGASRFVVRNRAGGGAEVEISLPLKLVGENGRANPRPGRR
jgi:signal transduction histidine kinase